MKGPDEKVKKKTKVISAGLLVAVAVLLLIVFILWKITDDIVLAKETSFDHKVFELLSGYTTPAVTTAIKVFTFFGSALFILPAYFALAAVLYFYKKNKILSIAVIAIGLASRLLLFIIKNIFQRDRPLEPLIPEVTGFSYPSGHSFSSFAFYGLLTYVIWKTNLSKLGKWLLSILLILFAASIAVSRVYLHVHYASDVIAGFCLSILWLCMSLWILEKVQREKIGH